MTVVGGSVGAAGADGLAGGQPPVTIGDKDGYLHIIGKDRAGAACAPRSGSIGGGLVVSIGGQNGAALAGTGVGCGSFYGLEFSGGPATVEEPSIEPAVFVDPGLPFGRAGDWLSGRGRSGKAGLGV
jgi:hypothetical protein